MSSPAIRDQTSDKQTRLATEEIRKPSFSFYINGTPKSYLPGRFKDILLLAKNNSEPKDTLKEKITKEESSDLFKAIDYYYSKEAKENFESNLKESQRFSKLNENNSQAEFKGLDKNGFKLNRGSFLKHPLRPSNPSLFLMESVNLQAKEFRSSFKASAIETKKSFIVQTPMNENSQRPSISYTQNANLKLKDYPLEGISLKTQSNLNSNRNSFVQEANPLMIVPQRIEINQNKNACFFGHSQKALKFEAQTGKLPLANPKRWINSAKPGLQV